MKFIQCFLLGLAATGLAACAGAPTVPVPAACGPRPALATDPAAAMVAAARAEWREWGSRTLRSYREKVVLTMPGAQFFEHEERAFAHLADYWCAVPPHTNFWDEAARADHGGRPLANSQGVIAEQVFGALPLDQTPFWEPWSAAFVSWVVWSAGVPPDRFAFSAAHWTYVADAIQAPDGSRAFGARQVWAYAPRAGDLVCSTRDGPPAADWTVFTSHFRFMHCDVVVGLEDCPDSPAGRCLQAVGGNVVQAVVMALIPLDSQGHIVPGQGHARRDWIAVLENLARPPAVAAQPSAVEEDRRRTG